MSFLAKTQATQLRREGQSYSEIRKMLNVSKSTLSDWLRDVELSEIQKSRLNRLQATAYLGAKKKIQTCAKRHSDIREKAEKKVVGLVKDPFFVAGLMLYWAEGSKGIGLVQFSNSDPAMIKIMMRWFRKFCAVPEDKFRIGLFIHSLHTKEDYQLFWQKITGVPLSQFHRPYIKPTIFSNRKNKLYEGTCKIVIHSRDLLSRIIGWKNGACNLSPFAEDHGC